MALTDKLTAVADAIRAKTGKTDSMTLAEMPSQIASIEGGGGSGVVVCEDNEVSTDTRIGRLKDLHLSIPNVITVKEQSFHTCRLLVSIDLPKATSIEGSAFYGCDALTTVKAPSLRSIEHDAFSLCTSLVSVDFPAVRSVGANAFGDCHALTTICLPNATDIGEIAFSGCTNLSAIILRTTETVCAIAVSAFMIAWDDNGTPTILNDKFYIPASMYESYRAVYEPAFAEYGFDGYFEVVFHKIEDYPEICG